MVRKSEPDIGAADVLRMFPTFVWKAELKPEVSRSINRNVVRKLDQIREHLPELRPGQSWQSKQALHQAEEFHELVSCIDDSARKTLEFLKIGYDRFAVTALWANINATGAGHKMHNHPNNFLSGVYYVQTQEGADTINFHDPRSQAGIIRPPVTQLTAENTDQVVVRVTNGTLLLFPSWLAHSVDVNRSDEPRVSVSFNIMFSPYAEELSRPLWGD